MRVLVWLHPIIQFNLTLIEVQNVLGQFPFSICAACRSPAMSYEPINESNKPMCFQVCLWSRSLSCTFTLSATLSLSLSLYLVLSLHSPERVNVKLRFTVHLPSDAKHSYTRACNLISSYLIKIGFVWTYSYGRCSYPRRFHLFFVDIWKRLCQSHLFHALAPFQSFWFIYFCRFIFAWFVSPPAPPFISQCNVCIMCHAFAPR